jgi:hypothetical protein
MLLEWKEIGFMSSGDETAFTRTDCRYTLLAPKGKQWHCFGKAIVPVLNKPDVTTTSKNSTIVNKF